MKLKKLITVFCFLIIIGGAYAAEGLQEIEAFRGAFNDPALGVKPKDAPLKNIGYLSVLAFPCNNRELGVELATLSTVKKIILNLKLTRAVSQMSKFGIDNWIKLYASKDNVKFHLVKPCKLKLRVYKRKNENWVSIEMTGFSVETKYLKLCPRKGIKGYSGRIEKGQLRQSLSVYEKAKSFAKKSQITIEEHDNRLIVTAGDQGDPFFSLSWNLLKGGELSDIQLFDTENMVSVIKGNLPGWEIVTADGVKYSTANDNNPSLDILKRSNDCVVFSIMAIPKSADGKKLAIKITQKYTVYSVGSIFCDFSFDVQGPYEIGLRAKPISLRSVRLSVPLQSKAWDFVEWEKQGLENKATFYNKWYRLCDDISQLPRRNFWSHPSRPVGSVSLGRKGRISNHLEFWMNNGKPISGKPVKNLWAKGYYGELKGVSGIFVDLLPVPTVLQPDYRYRNTWALDLGKVVQRGNKIAMRVWTLGLSTMASSVPSTQFVDLVAKAKGNVLFCFYSQDNTYLKRDWNQLRLTSITKNKIKEAQDAMKAYDMSLILYIGSGYVMPFSETHISARQEFLPKVLRYDVDGIYTDQGVVPDGDLHGSFKRWRKLRQIIGKNGVWLAHQGPMQAGLWSKYVSLLCTGEAYHISERHDSSYGLRWPIFTRQKPLFGWLKKLSYNGRIAVSHCAGSGEIPDASVRYSSPFESNLFDDQHDIGHAAQLYQIRAAVPLEKAKLYHANTVHVTKSSTPGFRTATYQISPDLILLVTTNFDAKSEDSVITLDRKRLGMLGNYKMVTISTKDDFWNMQAIELPEEVNERIVIKGLKKYDIIGHVLYRGKMPEQLANTITEIRNRKSGDWALIDYTAIPEIVDYPARVQNFGLLSGKPMKQVWLKPKFAKDDSDVCIKVERIDPENTKNKKLLGFIVSPKCPDKARPALLISSNENGWFRVDSGKESGLTKYILSTVNRRFGTTIFSPIVEVADHPTKKSVRLVIDLAKLQKNEYQHEASMKMKTCNFFVSGKAIHDLVKNGGFEKDEIWTLSRRGKMDKWFQGAGYTETYAKIGKKSFSLGSLLAKGGWHRSEKLRKLHVEQAVELSQAVSVTANKALMIQFDFQYLYKNSERLYVELDGKRVWDSTELNYPREWLRESILFTPKNKKMTVVIGQEGIEPRFPRWPHIAWYSDKKKAQLKTHTLVLIDAVKIYQ